MATYSIWAFVATTTSAHHGLSDRSCCLDAALGPPFSGWPDCLSAPPETSPSSDFVQETWTEQRQAETEKGTNKAENCCTALEQSQALVCSFPIA